MRQTGTFFLVLLIVGGLASCNTPLKVSGVAYQSLSGTRNIKTPADIPQDAQIIVGCSVNKKGEVDVTVINNTDEIMIIDRTKSFFRNSAGTSLAYYDPTVRTETSSSTSGNEKGGSINLGSITSAFGIGGTLGTALGGVNVGGSNSNAVTNSNTTYYIDQPTLSIAPHGSANMGRTFIMEGVGSEFLRQANSQAIQDVANTFTLDKTYSACNVCVSFSIDEGKTYDKILSDIYANTLMVCKVTQNGRVNNALRTLYARKQDALDEDIIFLYTYRSTYTNGGRIFNFK